jgi:hypothetical protein
MGRATLPFQLAAVTCLLLRGVVAQMDPLEMLMSNWQSSPEDDPVLFTDWKGAFHDGSGPLGTYSNNQESWYLINPCEEEAIAGAYAACAPLALL